MSKHLHTLAHPTCKYCGVEMEWSGAGSGLFCPAQCAGSTQAKVESARRNMDRKIAEERWVDPMTLENIIEESKQ